jgi:hypothetical protein
MTTGILFLAVHSYVRVSTTRNQFVLRSVSALCYHNHAHHYDFIVQREICYKYSVIVLYNQLLVYMLYKLCLKYTHLSSRLRNHERVT